MLREKKKKYIWKAALTTNLNGYFGAHSSRELMDDLGIQTASTVYISNHHWERLSKKGKKMEEKKHSI